jgi:hypothetical protein
MISMRTDTEAGRRKSEARRKIPFLLKFGNEEDIIAYTKRWNPNISSEQLERVVKLFRAAQLALAHPPQSG